MDACSIIKFHNLYRLKGRLRTNINLFKLTFSLEEKQRAEIKMKTIKLALEFVTALIYGMFRFFILIQTFILHLIINI